MTKNLMLLGALAALATACGEDDCDPSGGNICTVAGTGIAGFAGDGEAASAARLYLPQNVTVGPDGRVFVVDWNNHRLRVIGEDGVIETFAGTGLLGDGPPGPAAESDFNHPTDVLFDAQGGMLIAAWHNSRIKRIDASGDLADICGTGGRAYKGDGGPAAMAVLDLPSSVALSPDGELYILDQANQVIRVVRQDGTIERFAGQCVVNEGTGPLEACPETNKMVHDLAANPMACMMPCQPGDGGDGGDRLDIRMSQPFGQAADPAGRLVFDADGNLYFADTGNDRVRKIAPDGTVTTVAGDFNRPVDLALSADGILYVSDVYNSCVRAVDLGSGDVTTLAGRCGERGFEGDGGKATDALLDRAYGIGLDEANGLLYIADSYNHRIRVVGL